MKKLFSVISISFMLIFCTCNSVYTLESTQGAFLTDESVKNFIENHKVILDEIESQKDGVLIYSESSLSSPESLFTDLRKTTLSADTRRMFRKNGLDGKTGHLQIITMEYGIIACTIEEALAEIDGEERTPRQIENDKKTKKFLREIKSCISALDYDLVKKYKTELYEIFNSL